MEQLLMFSVLLHSTLDVSHSRINTLIILLNVPTFQNQSPGWAKIYGYHFWVRFSEKKILSLSRVPHTMCINRGYM